MGHWIPASCIHLDRHHGCRHPARRRSPYNPLRWLGLDRPICVFVPAEYSRDGRDSVRCEFQEKPPRPKPPTGGPSERRA
jgi:hypothetical protein